MQPQRSFDSRFSDPTAEPVEWAAVVRLLEEAELYWLTTVRADGRPHVTPLVGVVVDETPHFVTGTGEQKFRNLEHSARVVLTTGVNTWAQGTDVVVEGTAERITDRDELQRVADAYDIKYAGDWPFEVVEGGFAHGESSDGAVFRVEPAKVLAFAKDPHGQTAFRFDP